MIKKSWDSKSSGKPSVTKPFKQCMTMMMSCYLFVKSSPSTATHMKDYSMILRMASTWSRLGSVAAKEPDQRTSTRQRSLSLWCSMECWTVLTVSFVRAKIVYRSDWPTRVKMFGYWILGRTVTAATIDTMTGTTQSFGTIVLKRWVSWTYLPALISSSIRPSKSSWHISVTAKAVLAYSLACVLNPNTSKIKSSFL